MSTETEETTDVRAVDYIERVYRHEEGRIAIISGLETYAGNVREVMVSPDGEEVEVASGCGTRPVQEGWKRIGWWLLDPGTRARAWAALKERDARIG